MSEVTDRRYGMMGWGAVSPAGWSAAELYDAVMSGEPLSVMEHQREGGAPAVRVRETPPMPKVQDWMKFPRMRRTTVVAKHALHAAVEALGTDRLAKVQRGELKVGVIFCTMNGCVQFSRKFYAEVLNEPSLASPIFFPETVYNAPSSHISALLVSPEINYTLVGDSAQFVAALETGRQWLEDGLVEGVLVIAAEERDWLSDEALRLFGKSAVTAEGAAAVYLEEVGQGVDAVELQKVSQAWTYGNRLTPKDATQRVRAELLNETLPDIEKVLLSDGLGKTAKGLEEAEASVWADWQGARASVRTILGEGFGSTSGWQTVLACEALQRGSYESAVVSATGLAQQAAGAVLARSGN